MSRNFSTVLKNTSQIQEQKTVGDPDRKNITLIKNLIRRCSEIRDQIIVFKLPSLIIDSDVLLTSFAETIQFLEICGAKIFIVHDHTNLVSETLKIFGFNEKFINSVKVADYKSSQIMEMVLSGHINKRVVSKLCNLGCYAVGISCKDANLIQAKKSKLTHRRTTNHDIIDIGFVSEPMMVNPEILLNFEENNIIPVISPVASDQKEDTHLLDVNLTASIIAAALDANHLIFIGGDLTLGGRNIIVRDTDKLRNLLNQYPGEIGLIEAAISAIDNSTDYVHFVNGVFPESILLSMFMGEEE